MREAHRTPNSRILSNTHCTIFNGELYKAFVSEAACTEQFLETYYVVFINVRFQTFQSLVFEIVGVGVDSWWPHKYVVGEELHFPICLGLLLHYNISSYIGLLMSSKIKNDEPQYIEMKDFSIKVEGTNQNQPLLEFSEESKPTKKNSESIPQKTPTKKDSKSSKAEEKPLPVQKQPLPADPYRPNQPGVVRMNGMTIPIAGKQNPAQNVPTNAPRGHIGNQPLRTRVPQMTVNCQWCTLKQSVAGNSHIFVCCVCNNMNQCKPIYNVFICCNCHTQVCYQLGVSPMIRCSKCRTVNQVPISVPNYSPPQRNANMPAQKPQSPKIYQEPIVLPPSKQVEVSRQDLQKQESKRDSPEKKQFEEGYPDLLTFDQEEPEKQADTPAYEVPK